MDTKKIRALLLALEHGSLTAAAEELGYTQAGMTHMMNALEDEMGLKLLIRSKTGVHLSPSGQLLFEQLKKLNSVAAELEHSAAEIKSKGALTLRVGAYSSMARQWLPAILAEMRRTCSEISVDITMLSTVEKIYSAVKDGSLDCAMCSFVPSLSSGMDWLPLRDDPLVAVLPVSSGISGCNYPVENFNGQEFLMPSGGFELDIAPALASGSQKICPIIRYTNMDDASLASMVAHGLGVTVLSDLVMQSITDKVVALPLLPPASRSLGIISPLRRKNDKNITRFISCARNTISAMYST